MNKQHLINHFLDLVKIPSPSGYESGVADYVTTKLRNYGFVVWKDDSGNNNNCDTCNVYAYYEVDKKLSTLAFSAHMDTVQKVGDIVKPIINKLPRTYVLEGIKLGNNDDVISSDGKTILGADNKAGIAVLLELARTINLNHLKYNLLFFFPTREEAGVMGSSFFKFKGPEIKYFFNLDSSDIPGIFIYKSLGYLNFEIDIKGLSAHAAKSYDKGIDAIKAAGQLLTSLPTGKNLEGGWTLNIGILNGGSGTNVVCDHVNMKGEMRAFDELKFKSIQKIIKQICKEISDLTSTKISLSIDKKSYIPPFIGTPTGAIIDLCKQASQKTGLKFEIKESFSTSDSNFFSSFGFQTISVSRGGDGAHSVNEKLKISHLYDTAKLITSIIDLA